MRNTEEAVSRLENNLSDIQQKQKEAKQLTAEIAAEKHLYSIDPNDYQEIISNGLVFYKKIQGPGSGAFYPTIPTATNNFVIKD